MDRDAVYGLQGEVVNEVYRKSLDILRLWARQRRDFRRETDLVLDVDHPYALICSVDAIVAG